MASRTARSGSTATPTPPAPSHGPDFSQPVREATYAKLRTGTSAEQRQALAFDALYGTIEEMAGAGASVAEIAGLIADQRAHQVELVDHIANG